MEIEANEIKEGEFGEVDINLSKYEKKLVLLGYLIGLRKVSGIDPLEMIIGGILRHKGQREEGED